MARQYRPSGPFCVPIELLIPTTTKVKGTLTKAYPETGVTIYGRIRTFGGTEVTSNGTVVIENTATVETWFRSDIKADCRLRVNGINYEIIAEPENIEMRNQFLILRIRAMAGGA